MVLRHIAIASFCAALLFASRGASAQATPTAEADTQYQRYGLVIGAVDLGVGALMLVTQRPEVGVGHVFGAALVHELYGNRSGAYLSVAARTTLPVVGGMLGVLVAGCAGDLDECDQGKIVGGVIAGAAAAMILDWTVLARRPVDGSGPSWRPTAALGPGGFQVGVASRF